MYCCKNYFRSSPLKGCIGALALLTIVLHIVRFQTSSEEEFREQRITNDEPPTANRKIISAKKSDILSSNAGKADIHIPDYVENDSTSTRKLPTGEPEIDITRKYVWIKHSSDLNNVEPPKENDKMYTSQSIKNKSVTALNIPDLLLDNTRQTFMNSKGNCSKFPKLSDIKVDNKYWQVLETKHIIYFYSAYYDGRVENPVVRINSMINKKYKWAENYYCKLWFDSGKKKQYESRIESIQTIRNYDTERLTAIITCKIPSKRIKDVPFAVSIISSPCKKATNLVRIDNFLKENKIKHDFAVCVKGLDFPFDDISVFLVEWFELLYILGVHKVYLYELNVHSNVSKVLEYYKNINRIEVQPISLPGSQPNDPLLTHEYLNKHMKVKRSHEKLPYSDCFYKNMNRYKYMINLDVDEVLVPRKHKTWLQLVNHINDKLNGTEYSSFNFQRILSPDEMRAPHGYSPLIPEYMKISQNIYRSTKYEYRPKSIFNTNLVIGSANHEPVICLGKGCKIFPVPTSLAHVLHYRSTCKEGHEEYCSNKYETRDPAVWKYKDMLVERTNIVLKLLNLVP